MSYTTPEPEGSPSGELPTESSDNEVSPKFFILWMEMMKIENVVPYYSRGLSSREFENWKRNMVAIFEKARVLEQYWVQITKLYLLEEALSYWEGEKANLDSEVQ